MSHYVNSCHSTDMDKFYAVYFMIPRDSHHTPSMAAYKMIRLKFELACKSSIATTILLIIIDHFPTEVESLAYC